MELLVQSAPGCAACVLPVPTLPISSRVVELEMNHIRLLISKAFYSVKCNWFILPIIVTELHQLATAD